MPEEDRRGMPIIGPLGPGAYPAPVSKSSMCEGGENQPLREEEADEEGAVSLAGDEAGEGEVGSAYGIVNV